MKLKKKFSKLFGKTTAVPIKLRERSAKGTAKPEYLDKCMLGDELRQAREKSGEDLRDIANLLRIRYEYLKAIEEGNFEILPGNTYMIGFVKTYAKYLGLDPKKSVSFFKSSTHNQEPTNITVFPSPAPEGKVPGRIVIFTTILIGAGIFLVWDKSQETTKIKPNHLSIKLRNTQNINPGTAQKKPALEAKIPGTYSDKQQKQQAEKRKLFIIKATEDRKPQRSEQNDTSGTHLSKQKINSVIKKQNSAPTLSHENIPQSKIAELVEKEGKPPQISQQNNTSGRLVSKQKINSPVKKQNSALTLSYENRQQPEVAELVEKAGEKLPAPNKKKTPKTKIFRDLSRISIEATSNSWVQIKALNSDILYSQILKMGDTYDVPDRHDLFLTTGNIQALIVKINGKQISRIESPTRIVKNIALTSENLFKLSSNN
jgi:cytoskeleton protein RodZ